MGFLSTRLQSLIGTFTLFGILSILPLITTNRQNFPFPSQGGYFGGNQQGFNPFQSQSLFPNQGFGNFGGPGQRFPQQGNNNGGIFNNPFFAGNFPQPGLGFNQFQNPNSGYFSNGPGQTPINNIKNPNPQPQQPQGQGQTGQPQPNPNLGKGEYPQNPGQFPNQNPGNNGNGRYPNPSLQNQFNNNGNSINNQRPNPSPTLNVNQNTGQSPTNKFPSQNPQFNMNGGQQTSNPSNPSNNLNRDNQNGQNAYNQGQREGNPGREQNPPNVNPNWQKPVTTGSGNGVLKPTTTQSQGTQTDPDMDIRNGGHEDGKTAPGKQGTPAWSYYDDTSKAEKLSDADLVALTKQN